MQEGYFFYIRMEKINLLKRKIEEIIKGSSVPEDPIHSKNTLEWLLKLNPDADEALKIAALGHDIERAMVERKVRRQDYKDYDAFKDAHALNSANILLEIMQACGIDKKMIDEVFYLVRYHETGGMPVSTVIEQVLRINACRPGNLA